MVAAAVTAAAAAAVQPGRMVSVGMVVLQTVTPAAAAAEQAVGRMEEAAVVPVGGAGITISAPEVEG